MPRGMLLCDAEKAMRRRFAHRRWLALTGDADLTPARAAYLESPTPEAARAWLEDEAMLNTLQGFELNELLGKVTSPDDPAQLAGLLMSARREEEEERSLELFLDWEREHGIQH